MEKAAVIALLEKYWQAETTIEEEQALAAHFRGARVDSELLPYGELFAYFREEAEVSAGPDFGDRILRQLGLPVDAEATLPAQAAAAANAFGKPARYFRLGVVAAAAAILLVVASLFLLKPAGRPAMLAASQNDGRGAPGVTEMPGGRSSDRAVVTDTYDDPRQALAAVRHALLIASHRLNQGRHEFIGDRK